MKGDICWPKRLLESNMERYIPEPADDLFACILVVLHLLFPSRFNMFHQGSISNRMPRTRETTKLLQLWNDIEKSKIWRPFVKAARTEKYDGTHMYVRYSYINIPCKLFIQIERGL